MDTAWLIGIGLFVGTFGTLIGAGGGFILMPIFVFLYPSIPTEQLTAISLTVVFFNALSGSIAYARKGRIDFRSGLLFSLATIPGAIAGSLATAYLSRRWFDPIFSMFLIAASLYLIVRSPSNGARTDGVRASKHPIRQVRERDGTIHLISYNVPLGVSLSVLVGFLSSLLGIGGGIIHVPLLVHLLDFPVHVATATSHFILAVMAFFGTAVHLYRGDLAQGYVQVLYLAPSVVIGAQLGAVISHRVHGKWIIRALALALFFVGVRLLIHSL